MRKPGLDELLLSICAQSQALMSSLVRNQLRSHLIKLTHEGRASASGEVYRLNR